MKLRHLLSELANIQCVRKVGVDIWEKVDDPPPNWDISRPEVEPVRGPML